MEAPGQLPACPVLNPTLCMYDCFIRVKLLSVNHMTLGTLLNLSVKNTTLRCLITKEFQLCIQKYRCHRNIFGGICK